MSRMSGGEREALERDQPAPLAFGRDRRRQTEAHARWLDRAAGKRLPTLDSVPEAERPHLFPLRREPAAIVDAAPLFPELRPLLHAHAEEVRAAAAPLQFRAEVEAGDGWVAFQGVVLPYSDEQGVAAVIIEASRHRLVVPMGDLAGAVALAASFGPGPSASSAWDAVAGPARSPMPAETDAIARARLWMALASANPACRAAGLHAALDLALRFTGEDGGTPIELMDAIFAPGMAEAERIRMAEVVAQARRLGIASGQLAPLLDRLPGGVDAFLSLGDAPREEPRAWIEFQPHGLPAHPAGRRNQAAGRRLAA